MTIEISQTLILWFPVIIVFIISLILGILFEKITPFYGLMSVVFPIMTTIVFGIIYGIGVFFGSR